MSYRIFILNPADRGCMELREQFADDHEAVSHAAALLADAHAAEIWHGERLVARLGEAFQLGPRGAGSEA
jgi:hypothetical protein